MAFRGPKAWLWRWRRNPLKRRADTVEAWVVLGTWVVAVLAGVLAGWTATRGVEHGLARERLDWRPTVALVTEQAPGARPPADSRDDAGGAASAGDGSARGADTALRVWAKVRWTDRDGVPHTGQARVRSGSRPGTAVTVWTDPAGRLVSRPATAAQARTHAVVIGGLVGVGAAAAPFVTGRVLRGRLERRRMEQWDAEWARFGPLWGRKTW
ncbi:Rv1733c family protein [Streptomyces sp. NPDC003374]